MTELGELLAEALAEAGSEPGGVHSDVVGAAGLEPATSGPPALRASQLRHAPNKIF